MIVTHCEAELILRKPGTTSSTSLVRGWSHIARPSYTAVSVRVRPPYVIVGYKTREGMY